MKTLIYLNHVDGFLDFFDPSPPMWIILLNKGYVLMWIFREPPSPLVIHMVYGCSLVEKNKSIIVLWDQNVELHANYLPPILNCILIQRLHNPNSSLGKIRSPIVFLRVPSPPFYLQRKITIRSKWPK